MNFWLIKLRYGLAIHVDKVVAYKYVYFLFSDGTFCVWFIKKKIQETSEKLHYLLEVSQLDLLCNLIYIKYMVKLFCVLLLFQRKTANNYNWIVRTENMTTNIYIFHVLVY